MNYEQNKCLFMVECSSQSTFEKFSLKQISAEYFAYGFNIYLAYWLNSPSDVCSKIWSEIYILFSNLKNVLDCYCSD